MSKNVFRLLVFILLTISLAGVGAWVFLSNASGKEKEAETENLSSEEMSEYSYQTEELNTDLKDGSFVRLQFQIVTENEKAKTEAEHRSFQFKNILIKELSLIDREEFKTGLAELEATMKDKMNEVMEEGKVVDVYTTNKVLQ